MRPIGDLCWLVSAPTDVAIDFDDTTLLGEGNRPGSGASTVHFGDRFAAWIADVVILLAVQVGLLFVVARQLHVAGLTNVSECRAGSQVLCERPSTAAWVLLTLLFVVVTFGYHAFFDGVQGATPGKGMVGLAVTDLDSTEPIGFGRGLVRSIVRQWPWLLLLVLLDMTPVLDPFDGTFDSRPSMGAVLFFVPLVLGGLTMLPPAVSPSGRALHDLLARSRVIEREPSATIAEESNV